MAVQARVLGGAVPSYTRRLSRYSQAPRDLGTIDPTLETKRYLRIPVRVNEAEMARIDARAKARGLTRAKLLREEVLSNVILVLKAA